MPQIAQPGGCGRVRIVRFQQLLCWFGDRRERPALDRFHDDDRLFVAGGHLVAETGLHLGVVPIEVIELQLYILHLWMLAEDLFQKLGVAVEGKAKVFHLARFLELMNKIKGVKFFRLGIGARLHAMQPVVIDVLHAEALQLPCEKSWHFLRLLQHEHGQLISDRKIFARIPLHDCFTKSDLTLPVMVAGGCVEIRKTSSEKCIHHLFHSFNIYALCVRLIQQRQTHESKAKFFHDISTPLVIVSTL